MPMKPAMPNTDTADVSKRPLRFGPAARFELRPAEYRLLVDGKPAAMGGRALDLLMALAARPSELLTKNELLDIVWPGLVVEENNLRVQINALRRILGEDAIVTVPGRGYRLSAAIHAEPEAAATSVGPELSADVPRASSPQRLFGRDLDLARVEALLRAGTACITLVGMPGVGKSSLARVAVARWSGRSAWVDLAPLPRGAPLAGAIARALGAQLEAGEPAQQLLNALAAEDFLLVLDNAEHMVDACAEWVTALSRAPGLRLLVTSQTPLAISADRGTEYVLRIEPLHVGGASDAPDARDSALAMLIERITAADSRYRVTPTSLPLLAAVCRQLDGLPLALEMAAARVPLMGLTAVHDALAERFDLLSRGRRDAHARHRSLHGALAWSHDLLTEQERRLFRWLGVFVGGFTLDLAVTLTTDEHVGRWDIVDGLATLVERSLVAVSGEDPPRYRLLETMRAFALRQLASHVAAGEEDEHRSVVQRHATAVLSLFVRHDSDEHCLAEMENARAAFLWAQDNDLALAAQLSARAAQTVGFSVWRQEVTEWMLSLEPAMEEVRGQGLPRQTQAAWWSMLAYVLNVRRSRTATPAAKRAVSLWRQLDRPDELQTALVHWVRSIAEPGPDLDEAVAQLQQSAASEGGGAPRVKLRMQGALAEAARVRGDFESLLACREQELLMSRELGLTDMAQAAESNVCAALIELGRFSDAAERARVLLAQIDAVGSETNGNLPWVLNIMFEALIRLEHYADAQALVPRSIAVGKRFGTTVAWQGIVVLVACTGHFTAAARLLGYASRLWNAQGATPDADEQGRLNQIHAIVEAKLGPAMAASLISEGRSLSDEAAAALVLLRTD
jgi:predicted ATPase/DNA-binding winged helix-turn-helix (wHTH) protein